MFPRYDVPDLHHNSTAPLVLEGENAERVDRLDPRMVRARMSRSWLGMGGYLAAGVVLGLILIVAVAFTRRDAAAATALPPGAITDNVVHLHSDQIGASCWQGVTKNGPARITVSMEVGIDGRVHYAAAAGESAIMRGCVEAHVKSWEFLPQAQPTTMVLPFEIDRLR